MNDGQTLESTVCDKADLTTIAMVSDEEMLKLSGPPGVSQFHRQKLEKDAKKNWDLFYKRNGDRFFKRRYWTRKEFPELLTAANTNTTSNKNSANNRRYLLEIGCGCGDFALPILEYNESNQDGNSPDNCVGSYNDLFIYCCDISDMAIKILTSQPLYVKYNRTAIKAFVADITTDDVTAITTQVDNKSMDFISLVYVLSSLDPNRMQQAVSNVADLLNPGGLVLFRDYAKYDKAMIRFSERSKIDDQFYVRQDGTRAYFFVKEQLVDLFERCNFDCESISYVERETINNATKSKHSRIFLQAKFRKRKSVQVESD